MKRLVPLVLVLAGLTAQAQNPETPFPNSGAAAAQNEFQSGLFQLHNFEYADAARHFKAAITTDPQFALAYWGLAMTLNHPVWHEQEQAGANMILARLAPTSEARLAKAPTPREKMYLHAVEILYGPGRKPDRDLAYEAAMADLHRSYPNDIDATAFYALSILGSADNGRDFAIYMRAAAVLEEVFPQHPDHPGVLHYLIHSYDDPVHAPLGLRAARRYAEVAPLAGHAQHMTSHIFLALGMWDEVVKANENAMATINRQRKAAGRDPVACGHPVSWLEYGYLQQGRVDDARRALEACHQDAQQQATSAKPEIDSLDPDSSNIGSWAEMRADFLIESQLWTDPIVSAPMPPGDYAFARFTYDYANALAALKIKSPDAVVAIKLVEADQQRCRLRLDAEKTAEPEEIRQERQRESILVGQLRSLAKLNAGDSQGAVDELKRLAVEEQAMPLEFGPPLVNKPTQELLGEVLSQLHRPAEANVAFEAALASAPGRRLSKSKPAAPQP